MGIIDRSASGRKYDITLSIEDNAGNRKEEVHEIFIDRTPPNAPVVTYSDIVNDLIIMQGTAEAKSQLIITDSNGNTYTLTVPDNGKWSMAIPYPSEGSLPLRVWMRLVTGVMMSLSIS